MRINKKWRIKGYQISIMAGAVTKVQGVNSNLVDGGHIIMWEFDETDKVSIYSSLFAAQAFHQLPQIHLARSHPGGGFHAYCFMRVSFVESLHIVSGTRGVDPAWIQLCSMRGHWTLRLTDKGQGQPEHETMIPGIGLPDCGPEDLEAVVTYWARRKGKGD